MIFRLQTADVSVLVHIGSYFKTGNHSSTHIRAHIECVQGHTVPGFLEGVKKKVNIAYILCVPR